MQDRQKLLDSVNYLDDICARLPLDVQDDCRSVVHPRGLVHVFGAVHDVGHVREDHGSAIAVGHHDGAKIGARQQLIVGVDLVILARAIEVSFGRIQTRLLQRGAHVLQIDAVGR